MHFWPSSFGIFGFLENRGFLAIFDIMTKTAILLRSGARFEKSGRFVMVVWPFVWR